MRSKLDRVSSLKQHVQRALRKVAKTLQGAVWPGDSGIANSSWQRSERNQICVVFRKIGALGLECRPVALFAFRNSFGIIISYLLIASKEGRTSAASAAPHGPRPSRRID